MTYRIVRRARSTYTTVAEGLSWMAAMQVADVIERDRKDGEYIVRREGEPDWLPAPAAQSGMDWL